MDLEVSPALLRRAGAELSGLADAVRADLTAAYHAGAAGRAANAGWTATAANDAAVAAADAALAALAGRCRALAEALASAAAAYERADEAAALRFVSAGAASAVAARW